MYKSYTSHQKPKESVTSVKINHLIKAPVVMIIGPEGENLGEMPIQHAMVKAKEFGLDLVEVGPKGVPPVCKIMDFAKFLYEQKKKEKKNKKQSKTKSMKEFKFTPVISDNDAARQVRRSKEYLDKGHSVRLTMFRQGRQSMDIAEQTFKEILTNFSDYSSIEGDPKKQGRKIFVTLKSKK